MQARGPLMIEHRLIERMLALVKKSLEQIEATKQVDSSFIDTVVDFIRMYADRTHHGKEEDILFAELADKKMSDYDLKVMNELVEEHAMARKTTQELVDANSQYRAGKKSALGVIAAKLKVLADFYPQHIDKEDRVFFPATRKYFSDHEDLLILKAFWDFDRKMIHEKYRSVVQNMGG